MKAAPRSELDRNIPFVDAHHHLWQLDRLRYPWLAEAGRARNSFLGDYKAIRVDWPPARLQREFHGQSVVGTVHVEAACVPRQAVDETRWIEEVAAEFGWPSAIVAFCDLRRSDARAVIEAHRMASARTRGIRARPEEPGDPRFLRGLRIAADLGMSYELSRSPGGLLDGLAIAREVDGIQVVLAHTGMPMRRDEAYRRLWRREMRELAAAPNVAVKISGLGMTDHSWTLESIRPWVLETVDAFGLERCMFGTNWPVDSLYSPYTEVVDAYRQILADAGLRPPEMHGLLHGNAERLYGL